MNDESLKNKLAAAWTEHRPKVVIGLAMVAAFVAGFGTSRVEGTGTQPVHRQLNYTSNKTPTPLPDNELPTEAVPTTAKTVTPNSECKIKGNLGSGGRKTYHVAGGAFYDRTQAEICFSTEQEAVNAGFVKSSR